MSASEAEGWGPDGREGQRFGCGAARSLPACTELRCLPQAGAVGQLTAQHSVVALAAQPKVPPRRGFPAAAAQAHFALAAPPCAPRWKMVTFAALPVCAGASQNRAAPGPRRSSGQRARGAGIRPVAYVSRLLPRAACLSDCCPAGLTVLTMSNAHTHHRNVPAYPCERCRQRCSARLPGACCWARPPHAAARLLPPACCPHPRACVFLCLPPPPPCPDMDYRVKDFPWGTNSLFGTK